MKMGHCQYNEFSVSWRPIGLPACQKLRLELGTLVPSKIQRLSTIEYHLGTLSTIEDSTIVLIELGFSYLAHSRYLQVITI